ncbi:hypothetical protein Barb7_02995 [Bacteroidales bacterium Barb7]|nr:hypothetical protein Barb7_02995 [Bacteroidales bacterium Barb7]
MVCQGVKSLCRFLKSAGAGISFRRNQYHFGEAHIRHVATFGCFICQDKLVCHIIADTSASWDDRVRLKVRILCIREPYLFTHIGIRNPVVQ